ncbi:uncharacterized protein F4822DRAFT_413325 [Hypoxylon trugodes]|uniref:uncharacterized protein n=1 Tax=Hypoxylon trugodes TaxID=326681 RepID=UPI00218F24DB|nr:uncharacterized protein F4822DRAFT_413325 [Hypoxylon trugodes]KAI1385525.1 hypothetical protein F4822DRAFT_413325 [Hypoxylon trugodes]
MTETQNSELLTYEAVKAGGQRVVPSMDFLRLRWFFKGSIEVSIHVLEDATDSTSAQTPYQITVATSTPDGQAIQQVQQHVISSSSISDLPISSIEVRLADLNYWEERWEDAHRPEESCSAIWIDDGPEGERKAIQCCGEDRPYLNSPIPSLTVKASKEPKPFVTIHDFITAVHPWMSALEDDIRHSRGVIRGTPVPKKANLFVHNSSLSPLRTIDDLGQSPATVAYGRRNVAAMTTRIRDGTSPA